MRGLKPESFTHDIPARESHPTWVRGLKLTMLTTLLSALGRTLRGCVD